MFIPGNYASFHLRLKGNLVKHQEVSKYHGHGCTPIIVACGWMRMMSIALKRGFSWPGWDLIQMAKEAGKLQGWDLVAAILEID